jgi:hypothetical protein
MGNVAPPPKIRHCGYCNHVIMSNNPPHAHGHPFCNYICLSAYESEVRVPVPNESAR